MQADWMKMGTGVGIGALVGAVDQYVQTMDNNRAAKKTATDKLDVMSQYGTYLNYGVPILAIVADVMGFLPKNWEEKVLISAGQLAGRRLAFRYTEEKYLAGYPNYNATASRTAAYMPAGGGYNRNAALEQQRAAQFAAARAAAARGSVAQADLQIPVVSGDEILA